MLLTGGRAAPEPPPTVTVPFAEEGKREEEQVSLEPLRSKARATKHAQVGLGLEYKGGRDESAGESKQSLAVPQPVSPASGKPASLPKTPILMGTLVLGRGSPRPFTALFLSRLGD